MRKQFIRYAQISFATTGWFLARLSCPCRAPRGSQALLQAGEIGLTAAADSQEYSLRQSCRRSLEAAA
jgi:hypothetical protein